MGQSSAQDYSPPPQDLNDYWAYKQMNAMITEPSHNIRVIEAENGYILEYTPKSGGTMKKYVCMDVEDLRDRITACMVGDKMEKK